MSKPTTEAGRALLASDFDTTGWGPRMVREHVTRAILAIETEARADTGELARGIKIAYRLGANWLNGHQAGYEDGQAEARADTGELARLDVERLARAVTNTVNHHRIEIILNVPTDDGDTMRMLLADKEFAKALAAEYARPRRPEGSHRMSPACQSDLRCCRNDGHDGGHLYPTTDTGELARLRDVAGAARAFLNHVNDTAAWPNPGIGCDTQCKEADALRAALAAPKGATE